jgi:phospholipase C
VVSPLVAPGTVSHTVFDHTSLIRTILCRFAPAAADEIGRRVSHAEHLGGLLTRTAPAPTPDYSAVVERVASLRATRVARSRVAPPAPTGRDPAPQLRGFAADMAAAARELRSGDEFLPVGRP